jgi:hypothetical protein
MSLFEKLVPSKEGFLERKEALSSGGLYLDEDAIHKLIVDRYGLDKLKYREQLKIFAIKDPEEYIKKRSEGLDQLIKNIENKYKEVYENMRPLLTEGEARRLAQIAADGEAQLGLSIIETIAPSNLAELSENALVRETYGSSYVPVDIGETQIKTRRSRRRRK